MAQWLRSAGDHWLWREKTPHTAVPLPGQPAVVSDLQNFYVLGTAKPVPLLTFLLLSTSGGAANPDDIPNVAGLGSAGRPSSHDLRRAARTLRRSAGVNSSRRERTGTREELLGSSPLSKPLTMTCGPP